MKQAFLILVMMVMCGSAFSAELLVQAKDSPNETGAKKGDIIVVRPDGWEWGKEEGLPNYIVVKMPNVSIEEAKKYEEQLTKEETKVIDGKSVTSQVMVKKRKYNIEALKVEQAITSKSSVLSASKDTFKITEKVLLDEKVITK